MISAGNNPAIFETPWGKIGLGICFDLRFPELANYYYEQGCFLICYPGCFTMTTGAMHWELLNRSRALDNQIFVASCSTARNMDGIYVSWAHSMVVNPWGNILDNLEEDEDVMVVDLDLEEIKRIRESIPYLTQSDVSLSL